MQTPSTISPAGALTERIFAFPSTNPSESSHSAGEFCPVARMPALYTGKNNIASHIITIKTSLKLKLNLVLLFIPLSASEVISCIFYSRANSKPIS